MAKTLPNSSPFQGFMVYGPYLGNKRRQQRFVVLVSDERRTTMSYARYLLCIREARWLTDQEQADHIDDDPLNDDLSNLQILSPGDNIRKSHSKAVMVTLECPECGDSFTRERRKTHLVKKKNRRTFCSRSCMGRFYAK